MTLSIHISETVLGESLKDKRRLEMSTATDVLFSFVV